MCAAAKYIHDKRVLHRDLKSKVQSPLVNHCSLLQVYMLIDFIVKRVDPLDHRTGIMNSCLFSELN